jgi:hypothetical protein
MADRADRPDELVVPAEILDLRYGRNPSSRQNSRLLNPLSLRAAKILHEMIKAAGSEAGEDKVFSTEVSRLNEVMHMPIEDFVDYARQLVSSVICIRYRNVATGRTGEEIGNFLSFVRREDEPDASGAKKWIRTDSEADVFEIDELDGWTGAARLQWKFSPTLQLILRQSAAFGILDRLAVMSMKSRYSLRLYEMVGARVRKNQKQEVFSLDDFRLAMGIERDQYQRWPDFRRFVTEPAVAEVNQLSQIEVDLSPIKSGRCVTAVRMTWKRKTARGIEASHNELKRHSAGRSARRDGTVETVLPSANDGDFGSAVAALTNDVARRLSGTDPDDQAERQSRWPSDGIRHTDWEKIARNALPEPIPDLDLVEAAFEKFCADKSIPLTSNKIEKIFRTFCQNWKH